MEQLPARLQGHPTLSGCLFPSSPDCCGSYLFPKPNPPTSCDSTSPQHSSNTSSLSLLQIQFSSLVTEKVAPVWNLVLVTGIANYREVGKEGIVLNGYLP